MDATIECTSKIGNAWLSLRSDDGAVSVSLRAGEQAVVPAYVLNSLTFASALSGGYLTTDRLAVDAEEVSYDDSLSGLGADEIQSAIDNLSTRPVPLVVVSVSSTDSPYSITTANTVLANATGGTTTVILPASLGKSGIVLNIKKTDSTSNAVVVDGHGLDTIDGSLTFSLTRQWENLSVQCNGYNWYIL